MGALSIFHFVHLLVLYERRGATVSLMALPIGRVVPACSDVGVGYLVRNFGGQFRMKLGLQGLGSNERWIVPCEHMAAQLREKQRLLNLQRDAVFSVSDPGCSELLGAQDAVLQMLVKYVTNHYPDLYKLDPARGTLRVRALCETENGSSISLFPIAEGNQQRLMMPLDAAGRIVQEDLVMMRADGDTYRFVAGSVCFPARWKLQDKIGRPLLDIHKPVPGYKKQLDKPMDRFFSKLQQGKVVQRVNFSFNENPVLYQPTGKFNKDKDPTINAANVGEKLFFRCERQTLQRMPEPYGSYILFTIRTFLIPLGVAVDRAGAGNVLSTVSTLPKPDFELYKSFPVYGEQLLQYLAQRANPKNASFAKSHGESIPLAH